MFNEKQTIKSKMKQDPPEIKEKQRPKPLLFKVDSEKQMRSKSVDKVQNDHKNAPQGQSKEKCYEQSEKEVAYLFKNGGLSLFLNLSIYFLTQSNIFFHHNLRIYIESIFGM